MRRLGILTPSSNTVLEPATIALLEPIRDRVSVHFARFRVTRIADDAGSHDQFALEPMLEAARLLADARVDVLLWAGTSAAWEGIDADERLVAAIAETTGVPATTATLALLEAFRALSVWRYGLVVPYVEPIVAAIVRTFDAAGYRCVASEHDSLTDNWAFAAVTPEAIAARVRAVAAAAHPEPDAVAIHCTNLRGAEVAEALERELGIPVLDSVVVGLWGALRVLGIEPPSAGFGSLGLARTTTSAIDA
jgi:maleate isomerase